MTMTMMMAMVMMMMMMLTAMVVMFGTIRSKFGGIDNKCVDKVTGIKMEIWRKIPSSQLADLTSYYRSCHPGGGEKDKDSDSV